MPKFNPIKNGYIPTPPTCNSKKKEKEKKGLLSLKKRKKNKNKNKNKRNNNYANCGSISPTAAAAESNNIDEIKEEDRIFQLMPSKTGGVESTFPESLDQLTQEAIAMKNRLSTHTITNSNLSQFLLHSLEYVIYMVSTYCNETKLPPFNWETMEFPKKVPKSRLKISSQDVRVVDNTFKLAENAFKLSECGLVLPDLDYHGSKTVKAYACIPHPWYLNRKLPQPVDLFLNREGKKIWLEFKEFDKGNPEAEGTDYKVAKELARSIGLDHPIVSVIGDFAVAAFNEACEMHVKRDEHNNLHDFEFMECKYLRLPEVYYFYMTIEAIEEGNLGVYESQVVCSSDGNVLTLTKFVLTGRKPNGTKAMAISLFSFLRFVCKTLEGVTEEKTSDLCKILDVIDGARGHGFPMHKLCLVSELHTDTIKGLHQLLTLGHHLLFSSDCSRTTNPDVWSHPDNESRSGMVHRTDGTPCRGYDYQHPLFRGSGHYEKPICVWWCCPDANIG